MEKIKKQLIDLDELKQLSDEADKNNGYQLGLIDELTNETFQIDFTDDIQNPKKSHRLFYSIQSLLLTHLPEEEKYKKLNRFVREEKTIFLTGGHRLNEKGIRNADSRQAYISTHLQVALNTILEWIQESSNSFELFLKFRELNIKYGYFTEEEGYQYKQTK